MKNSCLEDDPQPSKRCAFLITRKNRPCKSPVQAGYDYCCLHLHDVGILTDVRKKCPYGNHTVKIQDYERHIKTCTDRILSIKYKSQATYKEDINAYNDPTNIHRVHLPENGPLGCANRKGNSNTESLRRLSLATQLGPIGLSKLVARINNVYATIEAEHEEPLSQIIPEKAKELLTHKSVRHDKACSIRHGIQQASIVGNMQASGIISTIAYTSTEGVNDPTTYIEMGAGKGFTTCMLSECCPNATNLVMVDNQKFQLKADRLLRHTKLQRICCNIKDFEPAGLDSLKKIKIINETASDDGTRNEEESLEKKESGTATRAPCWVGFGKHVCGCATDFLLRCCVRYAENNLQGIAIATCCHHLTKWHYYVGQEVMIDLGFTPEEFEMMCMFTGWALCGHSHVDRDNDCIAVESYTGKDIKGIAFVPGDESIPSMPLTATTPDETTLENTLIPYFLPKEESPHKNDDERNAATEESVGPWRPHHMLSREERMKIGMQCKRIIDHGRLQWLKQYKGFAMAKSVQYTVPDISGESRLLLAKP